MSFAALLPLAVVMVVGAQVLTAIFLVTSDNWVKNSLALLAGAAIPPIVYISASYIILNGGTSESPEDKTLYWIVLAALVGAAIHVFLTRKTAEAPKWMSKLEGASPGLSFKTGFLEFALMPPDILTSIAIGSALAGHGDPLWHGAGFVALTVLLLAIPFLSRLLFRKPASTFLPKARDWMDSNSWVVNEVVLAFFIFLTIDSLAK